MSPFPPSPDSILPTRRWDEEDEGNEGDSPLPSPGDLAELSEEELFGTARPAAVLTSEPAGRHGPLPSPTPLLLAASMAAGLAVGRLDARLRAAPAAVRTGWQARMMLAEAAASARLDGYLLDAEELLAWESGVDHDSLPTPALSAGLQTLDMLRLASRRSPRSFWTPGRLTRLAGVIGRRRQRAQGPLPAWLQAQRGARDTAATSLTRLLSPDRVEEWRLQPALLVGAEIVRLWQEEGLSDSVGGAVGRLLGAAWPWRMGVVDGLVLPVSWGFLGHAAEHAPWRGDWPELWLRAMERGARRGTDLLGALTRQHERLATACAGRRSSSRMPQLATLLIERPAVGSSEAADALGATKQGALNLLEELRDGGLVQEISRRGSHWVWQAGPG